MAMLTLHPKILLVSNQQTTLSLEAFHSLEQRLHVVLEPQPGNTIRSWLEENPDIIIFDLILPEAVILDLIKQLRAEAKIPILFLASDPTDQLLLEAYEAGADECILKPIQPSLFHAKLMAWLRRSGRVPGDVLDALKIGNIQFIPTERIVAFGGHKPIHLTNLELRLMSYLMERPGRTVATEELCQYIWGDHPGRDKVTLKNVVYRLRRKIEVDPARPQYIRTIGRLGYQFIIE